jgi:hypoxanthine phosphoribosyltransferase
MANLVGKNVLIVDEVDDTRTTLEYAVRELEKDVETARLRMVAQGKADQDSTKTRFSVFVLHVRDASSEEFEFITDCFDLAE